MRRSLDRVTDISDLKEADAGTRHSIELLNKCSESGKLSNVQYLSLPVPPLRIGE